MKIQAKLKDQTGASITYALLLFLVCAVVSSVVLAAGTAASGRMSKSVENDQRYYSVSSAAGYLKNLLDGKECVVKKTSGSGGKTTMSDKTHTETEVTLGNDGGVTGRSDLLAVMSAAALHVARKSGTYAEKNFDLNPYTGAAPALKDNDLAVKVTWNIQADSSGDTAIVTMDVYNYDYKSNKDAEERFKIKLKFTAYIDERVEKEGTEEGTEEKTVKVQKVKWSFSSISTL